MSRATMVASLLPWLAARLRDSDLRGTRGGLSSGGVKGETGESILGVTVCCSSALRYSGVGRRWTDSYG